MEDTNFSTQTLRDVSLQLLKSKYNCTSSQAETLLKALEDFKVDLSKMSKKARKFSTAYNDIVSYAVHTCKFPLSDFTIHWSDPERPNLVHKSGITCENVEDLNKLRKN